MRLPTACAGFLFMMGAVCPSAEAAASSADWAAFDAYVAAAVEEWQVPGLAIAVVQRDQLVFAKGYGTTSLGGGTPVDGDTLFSIGSTTKAIAAAAIGLLVDEGKLQWDTPVSELLPQFQLADPVATARLRVRDLLTHNAGLPNTDMLWYEQDNSLDEILRRMRYVPLESPPGSHFTYQNVMYAAAGKLTEVVSGLAWPEFVERRIFAPLGMERSVATLAKAAQRSNVAQPHDRIDGEIQPIQNASVDVVAAAGSVWSSVHDMSRWARFLLRGCRTETGEVLLKPATCAELFQPQTVIDVEMYPAMRLYDHKWLTYGLGWFQTDYRGRALDFHSGSIDGLVALIGLMRSEGLGVYVLANLDHAEVRHALLYQAIDLLGENLVQSARRDWNREIKQLYDGLQDVAERNSGEPAGPRVVDPRPPRPGGDYSGSYVDPIGGSIEVVEESGGLQLHWGRRRCTLRPVDADRFMCPWEARWRGEMPLEFEADDSGTVVTLELGGLEFGRQRTEAN